MDNNNKSGIGGILAVILAILGVVFLKATGRATGLVGKLIHYAGIGCIAIGVIVFLIVVAVIIAAAVASKPDEDQETKAQVHEAISEKNQQLAKMKSGLAVMEMDLKRIRYNITNLDKQIETCDRNAERHLKNGNESAAKNELMKKQEILKKREKAAANEREYLDNIERMNASIEKFEHRVDELEDRRDEAYAKMRLAEKKQLMNERTSDAYTANQNMSDEAIAELEARAQYKEDYTNAMHSLDDHFSTYEMEDLYKKYDESGSASSENTSQRM